MVVEQLLDPDSTAFHVNIAFLLTGSLDIPALEQALAALIERHRILRSYYYREESGDFVHAIAPSLPITLARGRCKKSELQQCIDAHKQPYDLGRAPLFQFSLFEVEDAHVLHLGFHHIIIDGFSASILLEDLWRLYDGQALAPARPDYLDYAVYKEHTDWQAQEAYFTAMFSDPPENDMPTRPQRPDVLPFADVPSYITLPTETVEAAARSLGVTSYTFLFSTIGLVLGKYCGSDDVVLGTALNGRTGPAGRDIVGMFANTLPVRLSLPAEKPFSEYVQDVKARLDGVKAHQDYPFERLVSHLAPDRNSSRAPIFDVLVNYLNDIPVSQRGGITSHPYPARGQTLAIDFQIEMRRNEQRIEIKLLYSKELYLPEVANGFMAQLQTTIERLLSNPSLPLIDAAELPTEQKQQIVLDFAGPQTQGDAGETVVSLFRRQVLRTPERPAVKSGALVLSYRQLDEQTDRLAAALCARGIGRGSCVGILVGRSEMMPVCALGTLKSGAAYLPLDASYPTERLEYMLGDAGVGLLIADRALLGSVASFGGEILCTDELSTLPPPDAVPDGPQPEDLMVLLYTSGTTGNPKGVMLCHCNLTNFCSWFRGAYHVSEQDGVAAYASFGFDACLMDMYPALTAGAQIHIIPAEMRLDMDGLSHYIEENHITVTFLTTQLGRQFVEFMENNSLRTLSVGGETLVPIEPPNGYLFYNVYGPTECTVLVTQFLVDQLYDRVPIGRAIDNTRLYVVDRHGRLAPVGVAGELCIAGRGVAAGYLNRPDITAEKFLPNPFTDEADYRRIYKTGDVVCFLPDGNIDFVGRRDFQVKIRGFRVELTEIEGRIREHPAIKDAAVVALDAPAGGKCAVAYFTADTALDINELNAFIKETLPPYMVPASSMQLDAIPLTPNGKVDRRKLPPPSFYGGKAEGAPAVKTKLGREIAEILVGILGSQEFSATENLLHLGLSSLSTIKLAALLEKKYQVTVQVREIMAHPTVQAIEDMLTQGLLSGGQDADEEVPETLASYPLSSSQLGVYLDCMKRPGALQYNIPIRVDMPAQIDAKKLQAAVAQVIDAHPILKMHLGYEGADVQQIPVNTLAMVSLRELTSAAVAAYEADFVKPFSLETGPLYRAEIITHDGQVSLFADFHHIAFDGASLDLFLREVAAVYEGRALEPEQRSGFGAALLEQRREGGTQWQADRDYFATLLSGLQGASALPSDLDNHTGGMGSSQEVVRVLHQKEVEAFCRESNCTPAGLFFAVSAYTVSRWTGGQTAAISTVSSGRSDLRLQNSFGMFVRTLPLVLGHKSGQTVGEYVQKAQEALHGVMQHECYSFVQIAADHGFSPSIMYVCELGIVAEHTIQGQPMNCAALGLKSPKFKVSIQVEEREGQLALVVQYDDALYSCGLMDRFADTLVMALEYMLPAPQAAMDSVPSISLEEWSRLDGGAHTSFAQAPSSSSVHSPDDADAEAALCDIFAQVLNLPRVDPQDSFFEIGGTSLSVTRVVILAQKKGLKTSSGGALNYGDVFAKPTPRALAQLLAGGNATPDAQSGDGRASAEAALCDIFAQVLNLPEVDPQDSFFEIGGSSLSVTRVVILAQKKGLKTSSGTALNYGDIFANPTPRALAQLLEEGKAAPPVVAGRDDYDYSGLTRLLGDNTLQACHTEASAAPHCVLLTGATGFLGIHMLRELLADSGVTKIICLMRKGHLESVQERLRQMMFYYFEESLGEELGRRVVAVEGDITDTGTLTTLVGEKIDTVINCAANVSHFAAPGSLLSVNTQGVSNLIELCLKTDARLVQISTASVAGFAVDHMPPPHLHLTEQSLYFGQNLDNQYVYSKFLAERNILEAALQRGLRAKIMRVGNLMARNEDGEFQINANANSFVGNLRAYCVIGCFPYSGYLHPVEMTPIDSTTQAVLQLVRTPEQCRVFHPFNNYTVFMGDLITAMKAQGLPIQLVEDDVFARELDSAMRDNARVERLTNLVAYQNMGDGTALLPVAVDNAFTTQVLLRKNWHWPKTGSEYMEKFLKDLITLGYFGV